MSNYDKDRLTAAVLEYNNGNNDAFSKIYEESNRNLFVYAKYLMKDQTKAEDLLQDTYVEIMRSLNNLKDPEAFMTWSKSIMFNLSRHAFRKSGRESYADGNVEDWMYDQVADEEPTVLDAISESDARQMTRDALDMLPEEICAAMLAYYYDEMPLKDIAEMLRIPEGTVKSRLYKGRKEFKANIESIEEKYGVKLHAGMPGILGWIKAYAPMSAQIAADSSVKILAAVMAGGAAQLGTGAAAASHAAANAAQTAGTSSAANTAAGTAAGAGAATAAKAIGTKFIAGLLAGLLAVGGAGYGVYKITNPSGNSNSSKPIETTETEEVNEVPEVQKEIKLSDVDDAYQKYIEDNEEPITGYDWQIDSNQTGCCNCIAITDINGDGINELIYMAKSDEGVAELHICTYDAVTGSVKECEYSLSGINEKFKDINPDTWFQIYKGEEPGVFYLANIELHEFSDEDSSYAYHKYSMSEDETITEETYGNYILGGSGAANGPGFTKSYYVDGIEASEQEFLDALSVVTGDFNELVMYSSMGFGIEGLPPESFPLADDAIAMSYDDYYSLALAASDSE